MAEDRPLVWPPIVLTYGVIVVSLSLLGAFAHLRFALFRQWLAQPINRFWFVWIQVVVCSGGSIAMMLFPGADGVMGWGMLRYDGAFRGPVWIAANEFQTQVIVLCFTLAALVNHPPAIAEAYLSCSPSTEADVARIFPRPLTLAQRRTFLVFANANCVFMYPLTFSTWMIPVERRSFVYTAVFLPLSLGSGIAAGIFLARAQLNTNAGGGAARGATHTVEVQLKRDQSDSLIAGREREQDGFHTPRDDPEGAGRAQPGAVRFL
ncbi:hypothetical protein KFE25_005511 [Diacronema lutheri]|uniref:Uncharacterized protein n=1 Tax=Diacronema lutheri TaxID=2081491 RepID=A0A8J5XC25_DIALT|nr:hypothetical protein KFE25_005511 [Diacronema lutheri]